LAKAQAKVSRRDQRRQEVERQRRNRRLAIGLPAAVAALVLLGLVGWRFFRPGIEGVTEIAGLSRGHDAGAVFPEGELPPTGGVHAPQWQNCGIYTEPVEDKYAVHSLEHGAVWLTYRPDLAEAAVAELQELARGQSFVLVSPYPAQTADVVASAWGNQLVIDDYPDERVANFVERFRLGPQTQEPGASCSNSIGTPLTQG
jgi:hypothetical protein